MTNTTRRNLLKGAGAAGVVGGLTSLVGVPFSTTSASPAAQHDHHSPKISGRLANATVTFGGWQSGPEPFDRFGSDPNDRTRNHHQLTPNVAKIEEGGTVNFIIGGFHNVVVYDHGRRPEDIDITRLILSPPNTFPPLIDDPDDRIYRGLDPRTNSQDRVETVHFGERGLYLVICAVLPHFVNPETMEFEMFGYVRVVRRGDTDYNDDFNDNRR